MSTGNRLAATAALLLLASAATGQAQTSFPQEIDSSAGKAEPVFGALWFTSRIEADQEAALAELLGCQAGVPLGDRARAAKAHRPRTVFRERP